jgi:hypothetical protein
LLGKMLQGPVLYNVWARSLTKLENPVGYVKLVRFGYLRFAGRRLKIRPQRHVNCINICWNRRIGHRLKLSTKNQQGLRLSQSLRERFSRVDQGETE